VIFKPRLGIQGQRGRMKYSIEIRTEYPNGCAPLAKNVPFRTRAEARADLASWLRRARKDLNVIVWREGRASFFATTVDGSWEGTRRLVEPRS